MNERWDVWRVHYATYAEIAAYGEKPRGRVAGGLSLEQALDLVMRLGFGHSAYPAQ
jgi:hypothetical protein